MLPKLFLLTSKHKRYDYLDMDDQQPDNGESLDATEKPTNNTGLANYTVPTQDPAEVKAASYTKPLFGLGRPIIIVLVILLLVIAGAVLGSLLSHKKSSKTIVVNTQTLDNGTLNKLTKTLGGGPAGNQLTISPSTLFKNDVEVQGNLTADGNLAIHGTSNLQGTVTTGSNLSVGGGLTVKGGANIGSNLTVNGQITAASLNVGSITLSTITLSGNISVGGHIITTGVTPSITASVADAGGTATISGNDSSGVITITTGKGSPLAGEMAIITFKKTFQLAPRVLLTPLTSDAAAVEPYVTEHATFFTIRSTGTPANSTIYSFNYFVVQ